MLSEDILNQIQTSDLQALADQWQGQLQNKLGDAENLVYRCSGPADFALRLVHIGHRTQAQVEAELAWIAALHQRGLSVCQALPSQQGRLLENHVVQGETFWISAFAWIDGKPMERGKPESWTDPLLMNLGKLLAELHQAAYLLPSELAQNRPHWNQVQHVTQSASHLALEPWLAHAMQECVSELESLPQSAEHYGLIHGDIHSGNFLLLNSQPDQLTLFDFDDCHWGWYIQDIAVLLYYALAGAKAKPAGFGRHLIQSLQSAYAQIRPWPADVEKLLKLFWRWRDLQLYLFLLTRWPDGIGIPEDARDATDRIAQRIQENSYEWL